MILIYIILALSILISYFLSYKLALFLNLALTIFFFKKRKIELFLTFIISFIITTFFIMQILFNKNLNENLLVLNIESGFKKVKNLTLLNLKREVVFLKIDKDELEKLSLKREDIIILKNKSIKKFKIINNKVLERLKDFYLEKIEKFLNQLHLSYRSFLSVMLTSKKEYLTKAELNVFYKASLSHFLVVSGLHFSMIYILFNFLIFFIKNEYLKSLTLIFLLFSYLLLSSNSPSALRAFIMLSSLIFYKTIYGKINLASSLSISFIVAAFIFPQLLNTLSFKLSYLAVLAIVFSLFLVEKYKINALLSSIFTSITIQIFLSPLFYLKGMHVNVSSAFSNLIISPLIFLFILVSLLLFITYTLNLKLLFTLLDFLNLNLFKIIYNIVKFFSTFLSFREEKILTFMLINVLFLVLFLVLFIIICRRKSLKKIYE